MYIHMHDVAQVLHPYLVHRCRESVAFSLQCAWLLDAYSADAPVHTQKKSHGTKLANLILSDELRPKAATRITPTTTASNAATATAAPTFAQQVASRDKQHLLQVIHSAI